jgi:glycogen debranching enzyme
MSIEAAYPTSPVRVDETTETPFYVPGTGASTRPRRTLKQDDILAVFDSHGDIGATPGGPDGVYFDDTRFLSRLEMSLNGMQPLLLGSNIRDDNTLLAIDLTNPDLYFENRLLMPKDTLHIVRTVFLWKGTAYQRISLRNHGERTAGRRRCGAGRGRFAAHLENVARCPPGSGQIRQRR